MNANESAQRLPDDLLDKLACPQCKGPLQYVEESHRLICNACRLAFRVSDGIPVLLVDEAESL